LCSPNNPSGNLLSAEKVNRLIKGFSGIVVVDEAYIDFSSEPGFVPLLNQYNNLVVLQTLSKAWGLAGLRLGLAFASPEIISVLDKIKPPYNINTLSQSVALQALNETEKKNGQVQEILAQRALLATQLQAVKSVARMYPSDANFILVRIKEARQVYQKLVAKGIVVRDRSNVILCDDCLRITVGTPEENQKLINELQTL
jgi:histidinol-phosphate aminotransferase